MVKRLPVPAVPCHFWIQISWQPKKCGPIQSRLPRSPPHLDHPRLPSHIAPHSFSPSLKQQANGMWMPSSGLVKGAEDPITPLCTFCFSQGPPWLGRLGLFCECESTGGTLPPSPHHADKRVSSQSMSVRPQLGLRVHVATQ